MPLRLLAPPFLPSFILYHFPFVVILIHRDVQSSTCLGLPASPHLRTWYTFFSPSFLLLMSHKRHAILSFPSSLPSVPVSIPEKPSTLVPRPASRISGALRCVSPSPTQTCFPMYVKHPISRPNTCCSFLCPSCVSPPSVTTHCSAVTASYSCLHLDLVTQTEVRRDGKTKKRTSKNTLRDTLAWAQAS